MFNWMRNQRMFVLMIVFIVFVAVLGFSIGDRKKLSWPENFVARFDPPSAAMVLQARRLCADLVQDCRQYA